ncbi:peptidase S41 [Streptomyces pluripotens]|uniref:Peptidase S41 n=1 Tax=Streptomyces pluripotens TaxID=1355015 RepID=A0A221P2K0_9ACTN|nr:MULTISPECIES: S41 family peptidase [Streptomyces]ARP72030.1 peptidase S41 [Streptomyces pluripotens]ASN26278.1 peptidase S41 [Streptomyces pluripotens]MCH0560704.1 S41 family peptidase [Streptomyces sp. MUM 16J]
MPLTVRRRRAPFRAVALALALAALPAMTNGTPGNAASGNPSLEGLWQSTGYGTVISVSGRHLRTYETTRVSCLPGSLEAERSGSSRAGGAVDFTPTVSEEAGRITLTPGSDDNGDVIRLRFADNAGFRTLHRVHELPERCSQRPPTDPRAVFDTFWQTYAENYPSFPAKGVDWAAVRDRYRPTITADTTDAELFGILESMIEPLHDAHTAIVAGRKQHFVGRQADTKAPTSDTVTKIEKATAASVGTPQQRWGRGAIGYADLPGRIGYLRITRLAGFTEKGDYARDRAELDKALDAIFTEARTRGSKALRALVIDLRFNGGGSDALGLRIASRLTTHAYTAYTKRARDNTVGGERFTSAQPIGVSPRSGGPVYTGPLAVLTGRLTVSAGETFTQALMNRTPAPVRIGENTQGALSDTMDRVLPNGWSFTLPNEKYLAPNGAAYDGAGIAPTIRVPVFTDDELAARRDSALTRARELLG